MVGVEEKVWFFGVAEKLFKWPTCFAMAEIDPIFCGFCIFSNWKFLKAILVLHLVPF